MNSSDFRYKLYKKYISTFKTELIERDESKKNEYFDWCDYTYGKYIYNLPKSSNILDLGSGSGEFLEFLQKKGYKNVYGVDISIEQIELAKKKGIDSFQGDFVEFLKSTSIKFDLITGFSIIEHLYKDEILELMPLLNKSINKSGIVILETANGHGLFPGYPIYGDFTHISIFNPDSLRQVLSYGDFEVIDEIEIYPKPTGIKGVIQRKLWGFIKNLANIIRRIEGGKYLTHKIWTQQFATIARKKCDFNEV